VAGPAERFVARLHDPAFDLVAGLKGTYSLSSDEVFPVWGEVAIDGQDARLVTAMEGPLGIEAREQIVREAMVTERRDAAPWSDPVPADATDVFGTALPGRAVDVVGSEVVDGQRLQHLASGLPSVCGLGTRDRSLRRRRSKLGSMTTRHAAAGGD
jgi:hypothetical protein